MGGRDPPGGTPLLTRARHPGKDGGRLALQARHRRCQGSTMLSPYPSKSVALRVASVAPCARAMPPIKASIAGTGRPACSRTTRAVA